MPIDRLPIIDLTPLREQAVDGPDLRRAVQDIRQACLAHGFFYVTGHGLPDALTSRLDTLSRTFFAQPDEAKLRRPMSAGGRAWRGYFRAGGELTSGRPDWKEGLYLGTELPADHPLVRAGTPLHGPNLWPDAPDGLRETVLAYLEAAAAVCAIVLRGIALSLDLPADYFEQRYTREPLLLFRIFNYPSRPAPEAVAWGVGEHTDYGLLTLLYQDDTGGLEVHTPDGWVDAPPVPGTFVCNLGDMLDRMTRGLYRSTPHRVRLNVSGRDRISFPLFYDPNFFATPAPIEGLDAAADDRATRWDGASVHEFSGTYGDYLLRKVGKVFPELGAAVLR
ncbi:isopenicillin N synthase family dioxygenase [Piscinibacter terrae]|uniref:2-oxoglutarate-dependent ethylene/succinate-forming enzyme n=1 Tax=Piscinibacter terrae TaxID=2496871 RepID=A0A3N7HL42_9BURK|nr:2-oxoglutarate and iron-dependent oxygenase domain-containing protein [Albitalea terrae]RQP22824.1 isopenicillin N synthase family oxygenase [Albitalea terrae]